MNHSFALAMNWLIELSEKRMYDAYPTDNNFE